MIAVQTGLVTTIGIFNPVYATRRLELTPDDRVARTLSAWSVSSSASIAALTALWGVLASVTSLRAAVALSGVAMLATPLLLLRNTRNLKGHSSFTTRQRVRRRRWGLSTAASHHPNFRTYNMVPQFPRRGRLLLAATTVAAALSPAAANAAIVDAHLALTGDAATTMTVTFKEDAADVTTNATAYARPAGGAGGAAACATRRPRPTTASCCRSAATTPRASTTTPARSTRSSPGRSPA